MISYEVIYAVLLGVTFVAFYGMRVLVVSFFKPIVLVVLSSIAAVTSFLSWGALLSFNSSRGDVGWVFALQQYIYPVGIFLAIILAIIAFKERNTIARDEHLRSVFGTLASAGTVFCLIIGIASVAGTFVM